MSSATHPVNDASHRVLRSNDTLPILDLAPYLSGEPGAKAALAAGLRAACEDTGFFFISNHGIDPALIVEGFVQSRRFFALPLEQRMEVAMNDSQCGFHPPKVSVHTMTLSEGNTRSNNSEAYKFSFDLASSDPDFSAGRRFRGQNQWPRQLPGFQAFMQRYLHTFDDLARTLLAPLALSLDLPEDFFDASFKRPSSSGRLAHYPASGAEDAQSYGAAPHKDLSFLTLIPPTDVPGLDVLLPNGEWLEVPRLDGAILVNTGLTLERWCNSRYQATPHRVRTAMTTERFSNIFFYYPDLDADIRPMPQFADHAPDPAWERRTFEEIYTDFCDRNFTYVSKLPQYVA